MTAAPLAVDTPLTSRHSPLPVLTTVYVSVVPATGRNWNDCALVPLQPHCRSWVPPVVVPLGTSRHCPLCWTTAVEVNVDTSTGPSRRTVPCRMKPDRPPGTVCLAVHVFRSVLSA